MTRYEKMMSEALEMLKDNDDLFVEMVDELDSYNGFADGFRGFPMWEIDDLFYGVKVSEFLDKLANGFNHNDEYFIDTIYGLDSCNDLAEHYRDNVDEGELLDNIIDYYNHICITDSDFDDLISEIVYYSDDDEDE